MLLDDTSNIPGKSGKFTYCSVKYATNMTERKAEKFCGQTQVGILGPNP